MNDMSWPTRKLGEAVEMKSTLEMKIKRGKESWAFIYLVFGILVALALFVINTIPVSWGYKIVIFLVAVFVLIWLCLSNAWFQNKIIGLKIKIEETWRRII